MIITFWESVFGYIYIPKTDRFSKTLFDMQYNIAVQIRNIEPSIVYYL